MNRIVILAAAAALFAGAANAQSIRISTEGKSADQVRAEVHEAALKLCRADVPGYAYRIDEARACVAHAERDTFAQNAGAGARVAAAR